MSQINCATSVTAVILTESFYNVGYNHCHHNTFCLLFINDIASFFRKAYFQMRKFTGGERVRTRGLHIRAPRHCQIDHPAELADTVIAVPEHGVTFNNAYSRGRPQSSIMRARRWTRFQFNFQML